jgi:tRNA A37 threonylcarbamoyltransferase TsaD
VYKKPLALVHHLEAHCLISRIAIEEEKRTTEEERTYDDDGDDNNKEQGKNFLPHCRPKVDFPFLTLLASGGHTSLLLCRELGKYYFFCRCSFRVMLIYS